MLYDTTKVFDSKKILKKSDIQERLSDIDIFRMYVGDFKIGSTFNSPLREDKNPSFGIFISKKDNAILYKDMSNGDCGDVFKFVKKLFGFTLYRDVYNKIYNDFNMNIKNINTKTNRVYKHRETEIAVKRKPFNAYDLKFWSSFGITIDTLKMYNVNSISFYTSNGIIKANYGYENPMYSYKVFNKFKIYRPMETKANKWRGNLSSLDIFGYEQLPETGNLLIITKSLKDVMVLREMGYNSIAPASESTIIPDIVIDKLKNRFKKLIIFYDRDKTGVQYSLIIKNHFNIPFILINKKYKTKDISDFVLKFGVKSAVELAITMFGSPSGENPTL